MYSFFTHFAQVFFPATRVVNATDNFSISAPKRASEIIAKCINQLSELILEYRSEREREIVGEREREREGECDESAWQVAELECGN